VPRRLALSVVALFMCTRRRPKFVRSRIDLPHAPVEHLVNLQVQHSEPIGKTALTPTQIGGKKRVGPPRRLWEDLSTRPRTCGKAVGKR
jgi:hypothetical protein